MDCYDTIAQSISHEEVPRGPTSLLGLRQGTRLCCYDLEGAESSGNVLLGALTDGASGVVRDSHATGATRAQSRAELEVGAVVFHIGLHTLCAVSTHLCCLDLSACMLHQL